MADDDYHPYDRYCQPSGSNNDTYKIPLEHPGDILRGVPGRKEGRENLRPGRNTPQGVGRSPAFHTGNAMSREGSNFDGRATIDRTESVRSNRHGKLTKMRNDMQPTRTKRSQQEPSTSLHYPPWEKLTSQAQGGIEMGHYENPKVSEPSEHLHGPTKDRKFRGDKVVSAVEAKMRNKEAAESALEAERQRTEEVETELQEKSLEALDLQKRWKQAARELNTIRSQDQGFYTVTDDHLIKLAGGLRFSIQNFSIQYFEGTTSECESSGEVSETEYFANIIESMKTFWVDVFSEERHSTIQAFLWRVLVDKVFDNFRWLGEISHQMRAVHEMLRPKWQRDASYSEHRDCDAERKFQVWRASTSVLLIDSVLSSTENGEVTDELLTELHRFLQPLSTAHDTHGFDQELQHIYDDAINLDKEICRQVARIEWQFPCNEQVLDFDPQCMVLQKGQEQLPTAEEVRLVIAPRMVKRGKSTGQGFETENQLLPMEVSLQPSPDQGYLRD